MPRSLKSSLFLSILFLLLLGDSTVAREGLLVRDFPDDDGTSLIVSWTDVDVRSPLIKIERSVSGETIWIKLAEVETAAGSYTDTGLRRGAEYIYRICFDDSILAQSTIVAPRASILHSKRINQLVILSLFFAAVLIFIRLALRGRRFFVRRISGLSAIEEAIGRATEMGKPVLFVPGIDDLNNIQTIASMVILNDVARLAATYETQVIVPVCKPFVVPVAEEAVKEGYLNAGRPELYNPDNVRYLSDEQFAFTAGVNGIMLRERTAANIYMGSFFAESLILAETGFSTGAIQVAGTANIHQLPFFVAACDYTLIGEELFAASAYLSREPKLLGALKASDLAKVIIVAIVLFGVIAESLGWHGFADIFTAR
ncbi:MAG: DUF6754 domain-containing protein [bacterium]